MQVVILSLADWLFMAFVIITLGCLATRRDALLPTAVGLVVVGAVLSHSFIGGLMVAFNAIMASTTDLLNIIIVIALIVMMTKTMEDMGSDRLMVVPIRGLLGNAYISYWVIGFAMLILSWFIWPTPAAPLLGALVVPLAIVSGLPPMIAAMAVSIFGKGVGLSSDFIIQGSPAVTAKLTNIPINEIISSSIPVWGAISITAVLVSYFIAFRTIKASKKDGGPVSMKGSTISLEDMQIKAAATSTVNASPIGRVMAWVIPIALLTDIYYMGALGLRGGKATALIGGTVLMITMVSCIFQYKDQAFSKAMDHARAGWMFAVKVFGPVVIIAGFFWLGGDSIKTILGDKSATGLMFHWGYWIAEHVPINKFMVSLVVTISSMLGAFDGSGYAAIPLGASIAMALGKPIGANVSVLAVQAQMAAIWTGATLVPWGFLAVAAAICGVDPKDLARRNLWPTLIGLAVGVIVTAFLA
ncbi:MAG: hypothetical protein P4N41_19550 [Negativicutes bacterium]|nr:hypothetical protein [Negativicutes bacterium]MDR3591857.1 hypothetical protein [Negativicutes bacterium]